VMENDSVFKGCSLVRQGAREYADLLVARNHNEEGTGSRRSLFHMVRVRSNAYCDAVIRARPVQSRPVPTFVTR
jgi:hypothetical protein